jgi:hypothetical protein
MAFGWLLLSSQNKTPLMIFDNNLWSMRIIQRRILSPIVQTTAITSLSYEGDCPTIATELQKPSRNPNISIQNKTKIKIKIPSQNTCNRRECRRGSRVWPQRRQRGWAVVNAW